MECQARIIEHECGCIIYYLPRLSPITRICGRAEFSCFNQIKTALERGENTTFKCTCLPACFELNYSTEISKAPLTLEGIVPKEAVLQKIPRDQYRFTDLFSLQFFFFIPMLKRFNFVAGKVLQSFSSSTRRELSAATSKKN